MSMKILLKQKSILLFWRAIMKFVEIFQMIYINRKQKMIMLRKTGLILELNFINKKQI